jgi:glutamine amidotransferase-like uncharacterized protein
MSFVRPFLALAFFATSCGPRPDPAASILLFTGVGTSPGDVSALEDVLARERLAYVTVSSAQLDGMPTARLRAYRLLIVPGGNFVTIGNSVTAAGAANVRAAVESGLNYLGICAGAFWAGNSPYNGLNLTSGVRFPFYSAETRGIHEAAVPVADTDGVTLDQYWEDGPALSGWGAAVARYPDGTPAIAQGSYGAGFVLLAGVHPEAPQSWRRGLSFTTPVSVSRAYAAKLIRAALSGTQLPSDRK